MRCPFCLSEELKVVDKRESSDAIRRRRQCIKCSKRFTTYERIKSVDLLVVKKDGRREPFDRNKVRNGILKACEKCPISNSKVESIVEKVENELRDKKAMEIPSRFIGKMVMDELKRLDKVAYIRFASVYQEFNDPKDFEVEVKKLVKK